MNVGSRMSTTCEPGDIQMSHATYVQVQSEYVIENRGEIPIKGKGMMNTYLLKGHRHEAGGRKGHDTTAASAATLSPFGVPEASSSSQDMVTSGTKTTSYVRPPVRVEANGTIVATGKTAKNANRLSLNRTITATDYTYAGNSSVISVPQQALALSSLSAPPSARTTSGGGVSNGNMTTLLNDLSSFEPAAILAATLPMASAFESKSSFGGASPTSPVLGTVSSVLPPPPGSPGTASDQTKHNKRASFGATNQNNTDDSGSDMEEDELSYSAPGSRRHSDSKEQTAEVNLIIRQKTNRIKGDSINSMLSHHTFPVDCVIILYGYIERNRWQARGSSGVNGGGGGALSRITSTASMVAASLNGEQQPPLSRASSTLPRVMERPLAPVPPTPSQSNSAAPTARGLPQHVSLLHGSNANAPSFQLTNTSNHGNGGAMMTVPPSPNTTPMNNEVGVVHIPRNSLSPRISPEASGNISHQPSASPPLHAEIGTLIPTPMIPSNITFALPPSGHAAAGAAPPHTNTAVHTIASLNPDEAAAAAARAEEDMAAIAAAVANNNPQVPASSTLTITAHPQAFGYNRMFECPPAEVVLQTPKPWYTYCPLIPGYSSYKCLIRINRHRRYSLLFEQYPELEWRFQQDYQPRFLLPNRGGILLLTCALAILSVYDTIVGIDAARSIRVATWSIRFVALAIGFTLYYITHRPIYHYYMQIASATALTFMVLLPMTCLQWFTDARWICQYRECAISQS
jgi:hypothetical protein